MKLVISLFLVAVCLAAAYADVELDEGVLVVTNDNYDEVIKDNEFVLLEFYAPWCGHCKSLAPEYVKAAKKLADSNSAIKLAKVDATVHSDLAAKHNVRGYPTLKFYNKGTAVDYGGSRTAEGIVSWLLKKTGPSAKTLATVDEAKSFIGESNVVVVGFFKDPESEAAKTYMQVAFSSDDHVFGITSAEEVFSEYNVEDGKVVLFKKFDDEKSVYDGELEVEKVKDFIAVESLPLIVEFNHETAAKIFNGVIKTHLLVFVSQEAGHVEKYTDELKKAAKEYRGKILVVIINSDEADHERILEFFGMKKENVPSMRIIKLEDDITKYKPDNPEISSDNILSFIAAYMEGSLKRHMLTQDLPEDWDKAPVKVLVGTNFNEVAYRKDRHVLVEFYAPWCGHCKQLAPIYDALGEKYKDSEKVIIAKMDATANELEDVKITSFPTITLYKAETNEPVEYTGERTLEDLSKFIDSDGAFSQIPDETQEEDEDDDVPRKDEL